jgi:hypothetical protein
MEALQAKGSTRQLVAYGMGGYAAGAEARILDGSYAATWKRIASREALVKAHAIHRLTGDYRIARVLSGLAAITTDPGPGYGTAVDQAASPRLESIAITSSSVANPTVITTPVDHGLVTGEVILITGHSGSTPSLNGGNGYAITKTGDKTFTIVVDVTVGGTGGSFKKVSSIGATADLHVPALVLGGFTNVILKVQHSADNSSYSDLMTFTAVTGLTSERETVLTQVARYTRMSWDFTGSGSAYSVTPFIGLSRP